MPKKNVLDKINSDLDLTLEDLIDGIDSDLPLEKI